ncbi:unnamed protein product [Heligmosomoides polygyrus]|uniref:Reverse transcriptase domain-containing protein n=1 Tax=Heligmosomoides polygyrus TaxID=6339 RepID=A0A183G1L0_HELPZ|nr:unnamed protein product [Heligmosomoides polygyrus]
MQFIAAVEVPVVEFGYKDGKVNAFMYVPENAADTIILGTNVLSSLGYKLMREGQISATRRSGYDDISIIRKEAAEHARLYREHMKKVYDETNEVREESLPVVGDKVFMKLPAERAKGKHPKLTIEWDGPYRVIERGDTSAVIAKIGANYEPVKIQVDLLRKCPNGISFEPVKPRTRRKAVRKCNQILVGRVSLSIPLSRSEKEFDVTDAMHFLHAQFRCQGQPFPIMPGHPGIPADVTSRCQCGSTLTVSDLIINVPQPASDHRVETVLEAARVLAIWNGIGTLTDKVKWICDPFHRRVTLRSVGLAYAFLRTRCLHISIWTSMVPHDAIMRYNQIQGWSYDMTEIFEIGWKIAKTTDWNLVQTEIGKEHHKTLVVVPETLRRLKHLQRSIENVDVFYYRKFSEVHLRKNELFRDELGHVVFVMPSLEPKQTGCWLPFVAAMDM